jgi:prepilin-type N-terminal cleavage/methylation domain-containing protein
VAIRRDGDAAGFTLIELLFAMLTIGVLAVIAVPKVVRLRERAHIANMKADLRNFAVAEESYFYDKLVYAGDLGLLRARGFQTSSGITLEVVEATAIGWAAIASHRDTSVRCYLYAGGAAPVGTATSDGLADCS